MSNENPWHLLIHVAFGCAVFQNGKFERHLNDYRLKAKSSNLSG